MRKSMRKEKTRLLFIFVVVAVVAFGLSYSMAASTNAQFSRIINLLKRPNTVNTVIANTQFNQIVPIGRHAAATIYPNTRYAQVPMVVNRVNTPERMVLVANTPCGAMNLVPANQVEGIEAATQASGGPNFYSCPMVLANVAGIGSDLTSLNWGGYVVESNAPNITTINSSWIVQNAMPSAGGTYSAQWIGIGGATDTTLIQTGTSSYYTNGKAGYNAWYEMIPASETSLPSKDVVEPNDVIHASVMLANSIGDLWNISISDKTQAWTYNTQVIYNSLNGGPSSLRSAEVIEERPEFCFFSCTLSNLTYFNISKFGEAYTGYNGAIITMGGASKPIGDLNYNGIIMLTNDGNQIYSEPLPLGADKKSFAEIYGPQLNPEPASSDEGQGSKTITAIVGGGPYTYAWYFNGNTIGGTSNTLQIIWNSANIVQSGNAVFAEAKNLSGAVVTSENDIASIGPQLGTPTISTQNVVDAYNPFLINVSVTGGSSPYTYNVAIFNVDNVLQGYGQFTYPNNTVSFYGLLNVGSYYANAVVEDAAGVTKNTIPSNTITVNPIFSVKLVSNLGFQADLGEADNVLSYTAYLSGGTGPYNVIYLANLYTNSGGNIQLAKNDFNLAEQGMANTVTLTMTQVGYYIMGATLTDEGGIRSTIWTLSSILANHQRHTGYLCFYRPIIVCAFPLSNNIANNRCEDRFSPGHADRSQRKRRMVSIHVQPDTHECGKQNDSQQHRERFIIFDGQL